MNKRKEYKEFWNRKLKWSLEDELKTYFILCEEGKERKISPNIFKLDSYEAWESHVKYNIIDLNEKEKREFLKCLNHLMRKASVSEEMAKGFMMALVVGSLVGFLPKVYEKIREIDLMIASNKAYWMRLQLYEMVMSFGVFIIMYLSIRKIWNMLEEKQMRYNFYADYMEIINENINKKNN